MTRPDPLAAALARAFLAVDEGAAGQALPPALPLEWAPRALAARGADALGRRRVPAWLRRVSGHVVAAYARPPLDAPAELALFVAADADFRTAAASARATGRPLRAVRFRPTPTRMAPGPWPVPPLDDVRALADLLEVDVDHLLWLADPRHYARRTPDGPLRVHRHRWRPREGRVPRLLEVPVPRLRAVQRAALEQIVGLVPAHPAAHGFVPGRSVRTHAALHAGQAVVVTLDLSTFFAAVTAPRVFGVLRRAGYPEPVAHLLTALATVATPVDVIAAMPPGGPPEARAALRRHLATPHLAQGAPTSPHLANLVATHLDRRLAGYARAADAVYTRYADDLAFSGGPALRRRADALRAGVERIVAAEGFHVNALKTGVQGRAGRQRVTGLVVNDRARVSRAEYDRLRALLHNAAATGLAAQVHPGTRDPRAQVEGRIAWVGSLDPARGARLRELLARVP